MKIEEKIPKETAEWLKAQNAIEVYYLPEGDMFYTLKYLSNTPIETIKEKYERLLNIMKEVEQ